MEINYTGGRAEVIQELTDEEVGDLHRVETERQFDLPAFNIIQMFRSLKYHKMNTYSNEDRSIMLSEIYRLKPKDEDVGDEGYYKKNININPITDYIHAWDYNVKRNLPRISMGTKGE